MVIYWGRRNLQFYSPFVALLSHFNAPFPVALVKDVLLLPGWQWERAITFPFIVGCGLACLQTELLCECGSWRAKEIRVAGRNQPFTHDL